MIYYWLLLILLLLFNDIITIYIFRIYLFIYLLCSFPGDSVVAVVVIMLLVTALVINIGFRVIISYDGELPILPFKIKIH